MVGPPQLRLFSIVQIRPFGLPNESGASGEIRTLKHLFLRQAAIPIRTRWHSGAQGRI